MSVSSTTKIITESGEVEIVTFNNKMANIWNGEQYIRSMVYCTDPGTTKANRIEMETGEVLECDDLHRFGVLQDDGSEPMMRFAKDLKPGMKLIPSTLPDGSTKDYVVKERTVVGGMFYMYRFNDPLKHQGVFNGILTGD